MISSMLGMSPWWHYDAHGDILAAFASLEEFMNRDDVRLLFYYFFFYSSGSAGALEHTWIIFSWCDDTYGNMFLSL